MVKKKRKKFTLSGTAPNREIGWIFGSRSIKIWKKTLGHNSKPDLTYP